MSSPSTDSFDIARAKLPPDTVAIVTGAAQGLGKCFAEGLLDKGAKGVIIADINEPVGMKTAQELSKSFGGGRVIFVKCDVTSAAEVEAVFAVTKEKFGAITLVVNNAGICNEKDIELSMSVNFNGVAYGTYTAIKYMGPAEGGRGGKIINISSISGFKPQPLIPIYVAGKAAVEGMTRSLMADPRLSGQGITFGILCPGSVETHSFSQMVLRNPEDDLKTLAKDLDKHVKMDISTVRDAFLQLVLDESWCGKVMVILPEEGMFDGTAAN